MSTIKQAIKYLIFHAIFWFILFAFQRIIFICINSNQAIEIPISTLLNAYWHGMLFDASIVGYLTLLYCVIFALASPWVKLTTLLKVVNIITCILSSVIVILLPVDAIVYSHWGYHADVSVLEFLRTPSAMFDSVSNSVIAIYFIVCCALIFGNLSLIHALTIKIRHQETTPAKSTLSKIIQSFILLIIGGVMIIPIRGGLGIAPLNTGRAFFSNHLFASHTAINPVWNFIYSLKRINEANTTYHFMDDNEAQSRFDELMKESSDYPSILTTKRPNIVIILLESFSAHAIEFLGGTNATPTIKSLLPQSVAFDNVMAASDRSGKGLVATMCGYPVLPTISIIQYPQKTQTLPFIAQKLRENGYQSQTFIYGGDLNFNNFNSLVTLAGFDNIITQNNFESWQLGDKWGAHDQYSLARLLEEMKKQPQPYFDFIFTLSSHEPYTVPMERQLEDDYLNSVFYTDKCLGGFFDEVKKSKLWNNTLFILVADHGHQGPEHVGLTDKRRFNIPLIFTGGVLNVCDTIINKHGTQIDLASTLLHQLDIDASDFTFSKNLLDKSSEGFSFFDFNDGFGFVNTSTYHVYDNPSGKNLRLDYTNIADTISGKAILQMMSNDNSKR